MEGREEQERKRSKKGSEPFTEKHKNLVGIQRAVNEG